MINDFSLCVRRVTKVITLLALVSAISNVSAQELGIETRLEHWDSSGLNGISVYLKMEGLAANNTASEMIDEDTVRSFIKIRDGLYLNVLNEGYAAVSPTYGYYFFLSEDKSGKVPIQPLGMPAHGPRADVINAYHFRGNVFRPYRILNFPNERVTIRPLEYRIVDGEQPWFKMLHCLILIEHVESS